VAQGWDHDPPAAQKVVPLGILVLLSGALSLYFGSGGSSDFWVDALQCWWRRVRPAWRGIRRLVIYLDNGPDNSGRRTQFLKRMVQFADWSGLVVHLVYYPPYHSKYNPIERCWSSLQKKWNGLLLNCWEVILAGARRMKWKGRHPVVERLAGSYANNVCVSAKEMKKWNARLKRSPTLPQYDIIITPKKPRGR
jgi:transposase